MREEEEPFRGGFFGGGDPGGEDEQEHGEERGDDGSVLGRACSGGDITVGTGRDAEDPNAPPAEYSVCDGEVSFPWERWVDMNGRVLSEVGRVAGGGRIRRRDRVVLHFPKRLSVVAWMEHGYKVLESYNYPFVIVIEFIRPIGL